MLRVACAGLGWVTRQVWLPLLRQAAGVEVVALLDPSPQAGAEVRRSWPEAPVCPDLETAVSRRPHLALIATPNATHRPLAEAFLAAGAGVLVEKPACLSLTDADAMLAAASRAKAGLWVSRASVERADVAILRRLTGDGAFGDLRHVEASWIRAAGIPRPGSWFTNRDLAGGGAGADLGWHLIDVGLTLLGHPMPGTATALLTADRLTRPAGDGAAWRGDLEGHAGLIQDVEDRMVGLVRTKDGQAALHVHAAWASDAEIDRTRIVVHGSVGTGELLTTFGFSDRRVTTPSLVIWRRGEAEPVPLPEEDRMAPYRRCLDAILDDVRAGRRPDPAPLRSAAATLEALYRSAASP